MTARRGGRIKQLSNERKERRRYWKLRQKAEDCTPWRTRLEGSIRLVCRLFLPRNSNAVTKKKYDFCNTCYFRNVLIKKTLTWEILLDKKTIRKNKWDITLNNYRALHWSFHCKIRFIHLYTAYKIHHLIDISAWNIHLHDGIRGNPRLAANIMHMGFMRLCRPVFKRTTVASLLTDNEIR